MNPVTPLSAGRIVLGTAAFVRPDLAATVFGLDPVANPQLSFLNRMFASREMLLGAATLLATGTVQRNLILAGVAVDLADAAAGVLGITEQTVTPAKGGPFGAIAFGAALAGLAGLRMRRSVTVA